MGVKNVIKKGLFSGLNMKRWIGLEQIKENGKTIGGLFKGLLGNKKADEVRKETFEESMRRFQMTEEDLQKRMQSAVRLVTFCLIGSVAIIIYMFYLFYNAQIVASFVCMMLSVLLLAYAFREHFNLFQMKKRRLGCSVKEWFQDTFMGAKK